ncbi:hypothetical protein SAY86_018150 [Trapa natans]|uniref:PRONE domain-containing protein n=1 Tax=Trapa natans TaxID=22666 RepID=A0AAN7QYI7_TRANT|nr:hypothetical protein SAY86_018150 [Trapa natans]
MQKSESFHLKRILESPSSRQSHSMIHDNGADSGRVLEETDRCNIVHKNVPVPASSPEIAEAHPRTSIPSGYSNADFYPKSCIHTDEELMKEKFAKLLLGENMSGSGKGVSSALALSNAITNLAASVFGELRKLEPMQPDMKARWRKEIHWLLSVTDHIVEFVPSKQTLKDGTNMEIMVTRQRVDLHMNNPALHKLDVMLLYGSKDDNDSDDQRKDDRWWMPTVKIPADGLSDASREWLLFQKESVNQVLKAAMAINAQVLSEMAIPEDYIDSLPKNGRSSLGDSIYKSITVEYFDPEQFLSTMDLSTEHKVLDLKSRIEASIMIWRKKMNSKEVKSPWGSVVSLEKRELFEERAGTVLFLLKQRFPGIPQSALDISKIQHNKDVGQSILESYSRVIESLAYNVISRIEDVLEADDLVQGTSAVELGDSSINASPPAEIPESKTKNDSDSPKTSTSMTLLDFMGWRLDKKESKLRRHSTSDNLQIFNTDEGDNIKIAKNKSCQNISDKVSLYLEKLENLGTLKSPMARNL